MVPCLLCLSEGGTEECGTSDEAGYLGPAAECNLQDMELNTQCRKQLGTFKTHALRALVEYSTLVCFNFHCVDPSMCISNLQLLLSGKSINRPTQRMGQTSMTQLQPNLEYVVEELEEG